MSVRKSCRLMKRKIDARQIVLDIRAGMGASALRKKHGLSDRELKSVYNKLLDKGLVLKSQVHSQHKSPGEPTPRRSLDRSQDRSLHEQSAPWRCPLCNAHFPHKFEECPKCGAIIAKVVSRHQVSHEMPDSRFPRHQETLTAQTNQWATVAVSLAVLALAGLAIVSWSLYRAKARTDQGSTGFANSPSNLKRFTVKNFDREVLDASNAYPVLIEFYADW